MTEVTRFAPSPTGHLHLGHAVSALAGWQAARAAGGRFLLRLEDIDVTRCRPEFAVDIAEDLRWLGLDWDGEVRVQSAHFAEYRAVLAGLEARGLLYPCFCTRADIARAGSAPHAPDGSATRAPDGSATRAPDGSAVYPGTCRALSAPERNARIAAGAPHAWRLDMARACAAVGTALTFEEIGQGRLPCDPMSFGDIVLGRRDMPASYHLCVVHDDAYQGVTLVTRGADLLAATQVHRLLQALLGYPAPRYAHHALITDGDGRRLAKRDRAVTLRALRAAVPPDAWQRATDPIQRLALLQAVAHLK